MKPTLLAFLLIVSTAFAGPNEWTIGGTALRIDTTAETPRLVDASGKVFHRFAAFEDVDESIVSKTATCLLLIVRVERGSKPGDQVRAFDYGYLLRVVADSSGRMKVSRVLERSSPTMTPLHRWIAKLYAVADDGSTAMLQFGEADREEAPYRMGYSLQKWDLDTPKVLGTGAEIEETKKP